LGVLVSTKVIVLIYECGNLGPRNLKIVWETFLPEVNPEKVHFFVANLSRGKHDSINICGK